MRRTPSHAGSSNTGAASRRPYPDGVPGSCASYGCLCRFSRAREPSHGCLCRSPHDKAILKRPGSVVGSSHAAALPPAAATALPTVGHRPASYNASDGLGPAAVYRLRPPHRLSRPLSRPPREPCRTPRRAETARRNRGTSPCRPSLLLRVAAYAQCPPPGRLRSDSPNRCARCMRGGHPWEPAPRLLMALRSG